MACICNGFCSLFSSQKNIERLQAGEIILADVYVENILSWASGGCPLAAYLDSLNGVYFGSTTVRRNQFQLHFAGMSMLICFQVLYRW